ncbi:MAG TPA: hypothetical protein VIH25_04425 [Steroidobacteraceae bacterium]
MVAAAMYPKRRELAVVLHTKHGVFTILDELQFGISYRPLSQSALSRIQ